MSAERYPTSREIDLEKRRYTTPRVKSTLRYGHWMLLGNALIFAATMSRMSSCHRGDRPIYDLLVVKKTDPAELAFFRKKTNPDFVEPAQSQMKVVRQLLKARENQRTLSLREVQRLGQIQNRLLDIMDGAKLRQIPAIYERPYQDVLSGISEIYRATQAVRLSLEEHDPQARRVAVTDARLHLYRAEKLLGKAHKFFYVR